MFRKIIFGAWKFFPFAGKCQKPPYFGKALWPNHAVKIKLLGIIWKIMNISFIWYLEVWCVLTGLATTRSQKWPLMVLGLFQVIRPYPSSLFLVKFRFTYPDECVFEYFRKWSVNGVADVFDGDPVAKNNGVGEVRSVARLFGENSDQIKMRPKTIH